MKYDDLAKYVKVKSFNMWFFYICYSNIFLIVVRFFFFFFASASYKCAITECMPEVQGGVQSIEKLICNHG